MNGLKTLFYYILSLWLDVQSNKITSIPLHLSNFLPTNLDGALTVINNTNSNEPNLRGRTGQGYYISVDIGTKPQTLNILIDTGSCNFAVASVANPLIDKYFHLENSATFRRSDVKVIVPYTTGSWEGFLGKDVVQILDLPSVEADIACITQEENFYIKGSEWQGILGLAYSSIARPHNAVIPLFDSLVNKGFVRNIFSIQLCGEQGSGNSAGALILGGIDRRLHSDQIRFTPLRREWYYDIILTSLAVGKEVLDIDCKELNNDKTIVDSGTTNLRLPQCVFVKLMEALHRQNRIDGYLPAGFWNGSALACLEDDSKLLSSFPELRLSLLHTSNSTFTLVISPKQYLRRVKQITGNTSYDLNDSENSSRSCYAFSIRPSNKGTVIGAVIMEGFYVVFDRENKRVGFAKSACKPHGSNSFGAEIEGPFPHQDPWACAYDPPLKPYTEVISYVVIVLAVICSIPLILLIVHWVKRKWQPLCFKKASEDGSLINDSSPN